ncbi:MAG TPA: hypothetical protein DIW31_06810 [Bacteroidales bacterium]|nr:hypothetical protein [Bacteroidales bacterium]
MIKIKNPFASIPEHKCFCCSPNNPIGLKLDFWYDEENQTVQTEWNPIEFLQGYPNVLHGGIQSTLMDEVASWAVYILLQTGGVTSKMEIKFLKPVLISNGKITIKASLINQEKRLANIRTELYDGKNELCAEGVVQYFTYPKEVAIKKLNYPGINEFLEYLILVFIMLAP